MEEALALLQQRFRGRSVKRMRNVIERRNLGRAGHSAQRPTRLPEHPPRCRHHSVLMMWSSCLALRPFACLVWPLQSQARGSEASIGALLPITPAQRHFMFANESQRHFIQQTNPVPISNSAEILYLHCNRNISSTIYLIIFLFGILVNFVV